MSSSDDLQKARAQWAAGDARKALRTGWRVADSALLKGDAIALRGVVDLAQAIELVASGREASDAAHLASYCEHSLNGAGGGVQSHALVARIARIGKPRKACPDCAEQILEQARVCRFCGYRFQAE